MPSCWTSSQSVEWTRLSTSAWRQWCYSTVVMTLLVKLYLNKSGKLYILRSIRKMLRPLPKSLRWTLVHIWFGFNNNMVRSLEKSTIQANSLLEKYIKDEFSLLVCDGYWDARLLMVNFWYFWIKWSRSHRWELNCFIIIFTHTSLKLVMLCASDNTYNPSRSDIQT